MKMLFTVIGMFLGFKNSTRRTARKIKRSNRNNYTSQELKLDTWYRFNENNEIEEVGTNITSDKSIDRA